MAEPPKKHKIAVLEDEPPPETPPPEPAPSLFETLKKFLIPAILMTTLFSIIVCVGVGVGWAFLWRKAPEEPPGGTIAVVPFVVQPAGPVAEGEEPDESYAGTFEEDLLAHIARDQGLQLVRISTEELEAKDAELKAVEDVALAAGEPVERQNPVVILAAENNAHYALMGQISLQNGRVKVDYTLMNIDPEGDMTGTLEDSTIRSEPAEFSEADEALFQRIRIKTRLEPDPEAPEAE